MKQNRSIYNFSDSNPTVLIVSYDEGDRIGSKYSKPDKDIYFDLQRKSEFNQNHDFFILKKVGLIMTIIFWNI